MDKIDTKPWESEPDYKGFRNSGLESFANLKINDFTYDDISELIRNVTPEEIEKARRDGEFH